MFRLLSICNSSKLQIMWQFFIFLPDISIRYLHAQAVTPVWVLNRLPKQPKTRKSPSGDLQKNNKHCLCHDIGMVSLSFCLKKPACRGISPCPPYQRRSYCFLPTRIRRFCSIKVHRKESSCQKENAKFPYRFI